MWCIIFADVLVAGSKHLYYPTQQAGTLVSIKCHDIGDVTYSNVNVSCKTVRDVCFIYMYNVQHAHTVQYIYKNTGWIRGVS